MKITTHNMNLSDRYVPNWSAWDVAREVVANALDTGDDINLYSLTSNHICTVTTTSPSIGEITVMGGGSKDRSDSNIGQFGEGIKLAALTACRLGGSLTVLTDLFHATFDLIAHPDPTIGRVLEATIHEDSGTAFFNNFSPEHRTKESARCIVVANVPDVGTFNHRFIELKKRNQTLIQKPFSKEPLSIYVRGVWIKTFDHVSSLWNWNLQSSSSLNRDRSIIDEYNARVQVAQALCTHMTPGIAKKLLKNPGSFEVKALAYATWYLTQDTKSILKAAFQRMFGQRAILADSNDSASKVAKSKGHDPISLREDLYTILDNAGVAKASSICSIIETHTPKYPLSPLEQETLPRLTRLAALTSIRTQVMIVSSSSETLCIFIIDKDDTGTLIVNSTLIVPGIQPKLLSSVCTHLDTPEYTTPNRTDPPPSYLKVIPQLAQSFLLYEQETLGGSIRHALAKA